MPVQFQLEPGKAPVTFRFTVESAMKLEAVAGCNPFQLAARGQTVRSMVLLVQYGLLHQDASMTERRAAKLVERFIANEGDVKTLMKALGEALEESGVYGRPEGDEEASEEDPTTATEKESTDPE